MKKPVLLTFPILKKVNVIFLGFFFLYILVSTSNLLVAQSISINTAKEIARKHLLSVSKSNLKSASPNKARFQLSSITAAIDNRDTLYFILNDTINKGFVIVAADRRVWPILGYSLNGSFSEKNQPPAFVAWMESRKKEIAYIKQNNLQPESKINQQWDNLSSSNSNNSETATSVEPLIQTKWDQGCYYNELCPADAAGQCGHVWTGCTITAMAQIMKYWNYPTKGTGSHSYSHPIYGDLSADFGSTTYQWSQMPNEVTGQNEAIATLMYHCGVSLDTDYSPYASGADDPRDELVKYFDYSSKALRVDKIGFTTSEWINLLKSELDLLHPIWYTGGSLVNHAFICDGYQDANYFHFNWGWGGSADGYFYIENLNPNGYNFSGYEYALINILPGSLPDGYNGFFLSSNILDVNIKGGTVFADICSSVNWTAASNQSWLSLSTSIGVPGKTTVTLTATGNNTGGDRSGTVTISAAGFGDQTITVDQLTKVKVLPGGLYNLIASKATTITTLTLTGTIDARDFKTMRDAMPALTDVDLSDVTIVAYTGSDGTNGGGSNLVYDANTIPPVAFTLSCNRQNLLKSIILPATITSIEGQVFWSSKYLTSINIPSSVTNIDNHSFSECLALINVDSNNQNYSSIDGVLFNKNQTTILHYPNSRMGNYTIPSSVTSIGFLAFYKCSGLTSVTIPSSVTTIDFFAFAKCSGITNIFIPSSVTSIGIEAFDGCSALINVDAKNLNYSSIDGILFNKTQTNLIQCPTSKKGIYTIPSSVTSIGRYAFSDCSGLTSVTIPSSVTTIELSAFMGCGGLTNITIPPTITSIEYGTFGFCNGLNSVIIPSSIISIENCAFVGCTGLRSIYIYMKSPPSLDNSVDVFNHVNKTTCTLYVPYGAKPTYQAANLWKDFTNIVELSSYMIANAGQDQVINEGMLVTLDGTGSTNTNNTALYYKWTAPAEITLSSETALKPTFTAPEVSTDTNFTFSLIVNDGSVNSTADQVIVTVKQGNTPPIANAGANQLVNENSLVTLDGSASIDPDQDDLSYLWTAPAGITLSSETVNNPTFIAPEVSQDNIYTFILVVNDGKTDSDTSQVSIIVKQVLPVLKLVSKTNESYIPSNEVTYQIYIKKGDSFYEEISTPVLNGDTTLFTVEPGVWIVLASPAQNSSTFIATYLGNTLDWINAEHIIIQDKSNIFKEITCFTPEITNSGTGQISGYVSENPNSGTKSISLAEPPMVTNNPIPGALVRLFKKDSTVPVFSVFTDAQGNYKFDYLEIADYEIVIELPGFTQSENFTIVLSSEKPLATAYFSVNTTLQVITDNKSLQLFRLKIYPNPTSGKVKIAFDQVPSEGILVTITNITGETIQKLLIQNKEEWIDLSGNVPGIYLIRTNQENSKVQKVILK